MENLPKYWIIEITSYNISKINQYRSTLPKYNHPLELGGYGYYGLTDDSDIPAGIGHYSGKGMLITDEQFNKFILNKTLTSKSLTNDLLNIELTNL